jgi:hypothetical protein
MSPDSPVNRLSGEADNETVKKNQHASHIQLQSDDRKPASDAPKRSLKLQHGARKYVSGIIELFTSQVVMKPPQTKNTE